MEKTRFENIKNNIGSSIRMKLDIIRKNLHDNKAVCLVGAGFSKNAEMDEVTTMKDWPELGMEFYKSLYGENVSSEDLKFKSVLRLASQVEAVQGRAALEALIQNSLPNERVFPGRLHIELMKLPWSDVFTTNYDTLLEKAFIDADRYYYTVTNKETLLYTPHPRIVKLHGSFPDIRPFIITEKDFRTYPQKFPEFVNTVRQSLIENVLCLIGFSGDDPNFLSWLGWLRDVMGSQSSPVYQITFDKNQHDANVMLSYNLGISIVNLAEIADLTNYTDALDFFMQYLAQEFSTKWSGNISSNVLELKDHDKVVNFIGSMKDKRTTYPGWYLLPSKNIGQFDDLKSSFPFYGSMYANCNLTLQEKVDFLYEINWRLRVSCSSCEVEWYLDAVENFATDEDTINDLKIRRKVNTLLISLLEYYRTQGDIIKYVHIQEVLNSHKSDLTYEQRTTYTYQRCLYSVSRLDYEEANRLLNQWSLRSLDYKGALWKSCVFFEVGRNMEAEGLLKDMLKAVKRNILTDSYSEQLVSARSAIEYRIWYLDVIHNDKPVKNPDFDVDGVLEYCCNMISKSNERPAEFMHTHDFNLLSSGRQWNSGESGFKGDYLGAYRYFKVYETLGIPIGVVGGVSIEAQKKKTILNVLAKYNMGYALSLLFRCGDNSVLKFVLNRDNLRQLPRETAKNFFDNNIEICRKGIRSNTPADLRFRVLSVLLPALTRMSVKLDSIKNKELFEIWTSVYKDYDRFYDSSMITTLYMNTTGQSLVECEQMALECPIKKDDFIKDMVMPQWNLKFLQVSDEAYSILIDALGAESDLKEGRVYDRLEKIFRCSLTEIQRDMIDAAVCLWRGREPLSLFKMLSLCVVKPKGKAEQLYKTLIKKELDELCAISYANNRSSEFISKFENQLCRMQALYPFMTVEDHCRFVNKINMFFTDNEDMFKKDDSRDFFGGFHSFVEHVFFQLKVYTSMDSLPSSDNDTWKDLIKTLSRYRKYNYPVLTSIVQLSYLGKYDRTRLKDLIAETLFVDRQELVDDAATALVYMAKKQGRRLNQALLKQIISYVTYTFNERTSTYLHLLLNVMLRGGVSKEAKNQLIDYLNSFDKLQEAFSVKEEIKAEIMYHANILAGAASIVYPEWTGVEKWKDSWNDDTMFNDVRAGFEKGVSFASNIEI